MNDVRPPKVSVCIANYNGAKVLDDCLRSVLDQDIEARIEIIVHDDASTDASLQILREHYPQVTVVASERNVGFCVSNNRMVAQARGEFVLLLNNDAALALDAIATLMQESEKQEPRGILTLPQFDWDTGMLVDRGCLLDPFYNPVPNFDAERRDVAMTIGACLWIPRALWVELGGFPDWFESIGEDLYLCCRARLSGHPVQVAGRSIYRHRQGASFGGNRVGENGLRTTYRRRRLSERNKTFTMILCTPGKLIWFLLPLHLVILSAEGALLTALRGDVSLWQQIYAPIWRDIWERRKQLASLRKAIQSSVRIMARSYFGGFTPRLRKLDMLLRHGVPDVR